MTATSPRPEFNSSELSRNSAEVFRAAEEQAVLITRRNATSLVLMPERDFDVRQQLIELAADLIAALIDGTGSLTERMTDRFPWMLALTTEDRDACSRELIESARASLATNQPRLAAATFTSWYETASALAAGLEDEPVDWIDEPTLLRRPSRQSEETA